MTAKTKTSRTKKKMKTTFKPHTLIRDMTSDEYHSTPGTFSSSQFKDLLKSEKLFIQKHINKTVAREENDAFDVGTYFHTGVLEPHKLKMDCVVYPGKQRRGKEWDKFKAKHRGKAIVTQIQKDTAVGLVKAVQNSPTAQRFLDGEPEVSLFVELNVHDGQIYAPYFGKMLTRAGWVDGPKKRIDGAYKVIVKVRADMLGDTYISDLKSTTGDAESEESMHNVAKRYSYQLSGALYLDMFSLMNPDLEKFWLIFASKELFNCMPYEIEQRKLMVGRCQYMWAVKRLAEMAKVNFESIERTGVLKVLPEELHWLEERDIDLL